MFVNVGNPCSGFKGDVAPRPGGNGSVTISDWVQVGRFAAGLVDPTNDCEFAKADCAPRPCGNGVISISDWVQAGRYAAGLDVLVALPCPLPAPAAPLVLQAKGVPKGAQAPGVRSLTVSNLTVAHGRTNCLRIYLNAQTNEYALGMTVGFDASLLTIVSFNLEGYATNAGFSFTNFMTPGRLGFSLQLNQDDIFPPGLQPVAEVCFQAVDGTDSVTRDLTIEQRPIAPEVVAPDATDLDTLFQGGTASITGNLSFTPITMSGGGHVGLTLAGPPGGVCDLQWSSNLAQWYHLVYLTNTTGSVSYLNASNNASPRFYRAVEP